MDVIENHKLSMETLNSDLQKCKDDAAKEVGLFRSRMLSKAKAVERLIQEEQLKLDNLENNLASARHIREEKLRVANLQLEAQEGRRVRNTEYEKFPATEEAIAG